MPVALIGLPLVVQALDNPESLDGMGKGNPRAARSLQFVPLDAQPDRLTVTGRAVVIRPSTHFCESLSRFPFPLGLFPLLPFPFPLLDCLTLGNHARQIVGQGQARRKPKNSANRFASSTKPPQFGQSIRACVAALWHTCRQGPCNRAR